MARSDNFFSFAAEKLNLEIFMTSIIVILFIVGYACIALESGLKVNKTAVALLMCVLCWVLYMVDCGVYVPQFYPEEFSKFCAESFGGTTAELSRAFASEHLLLNHLGDACEIIFFLMGAMTIVEIVDSNGGFNFVRERLGTRNKRALLWRIVLMTFFLSAILDNLTTSIVMIMVLRKLVADHKERMIFAAMVILAANSGGAFSPIGDVTTIMLWIKGNISTLGVIKEVFLPSIASVVVPALILQFKLKGELVPAGADTQMTSAQHFSALQRQWVFWVGVGGLMLVPIFRTLTGLPPFMGILLVLSVLWIMTELFYSRKKDIETTTQQRVSNLLHRIDMTTILFFLGILMTVGVLAEIGVLGEFGKWLDNVSNHNAYLVTGIIGVVSSIVDNVPLVASCMGMYDIAPLTVTDPTLLNFVQDGVFWQLLAYCAGVGGSILIIGSAAGVVVMGLEKISFGWYLRHISWIAFLGYLAGIIVYWLEKSFLF